MNNLVKEKSVEILTYNTIIIGSGAAGLNAAVSLWRQGVRDIAILTEGLVFGTSRNTGSDKQTYYKLTACGSEPDSVRQMAQALFSGGSMDGDIALAEAAVSNRAFYHLVNIGVPFPHNAWGEYAGYKTDHDPCRRGTSAGPLTSKFMTEALIEEVRQLQIPIYEDYQVVELLTAPDGEDRRAVGALALKLKREQPAYTIFGAVNVIYATGGEAGMYQASVYPALQVGGTGTALRAGVRGKNLTESQYGIASIKFRWNLSGSYQQVLPRYVSTDQEGNDEREFLNDCFPDGRTQLQAIFLKGYQWPFDPRKAMDYGSSLIDILIYIETVEKKRRVFLDYRSNPSCAMTDGHMDFSRLSQEALEYLKNSDSMQETPIQRLEHMNPAAIELYQSHSIDLWKERLEIAICAQHNNGGLCGGSWWESNIRHLFPVGEVNGTHGVYRPGGSALNSGQVGGIRAAQYIAAHYAQAAPDPEALLAAVSDQVEKALRFGEEALSRRTETFDSGVELEQLRSRMSRCGAMIRDREEVRAAIEEARDQIGRIETQGCVDNPFKLGRLFRLRDLAVSQFTYLSAIDDYIAAGGRSRGSYLICDPDGRKPLEGLPDKFRFSIETELESKIQETVYDPEGCRFFWRGRREIPEEAEWFETVWQQYRSGEIFRF